MNFLLIKKVCFLFFSMHMVINNEYNDWLLKYQWLNEVKLNKKKSKKTQKLYSFDDKNKKGKKNKGKFLLSNLVLIFDK